MAHTSNTVDSNHFHSVKILLFLSARFRWNSWHWTSGVNVHNKNSQSICAVLTFDPQLNKILTFSVNDRYQLNYFICIKDFNAETNRFLHTLLGKTGWSSTSDRNFMSFREWSAAKRAKGHRNFYHERKITRAFPTTHVSTYFFRKLLETPAIDQ